MKLGFIMGEKVLITSALPYINSIKHLGNLIGSIFQLSISESIKMGLQFSYNIGKALPANVRD